MSNFQVNSCNLQNLSTCNRNDLLQLLIKLILVLNSKDEITLNTGSPKVTVTYPKEGDVLYAGMSYTIHWKAENLKGDSFVVYVKLPNQPMHYLETLPKATNSYTWKIPEEYAGKQISIWVGSELNGDLETIVGNGEVLVNVIKRPNLPDLVVQDIYYDSDYIKVKYCNLGDSFGSGDFLIKLRNEATGKEFLGNSYHRFNIPQPGHCVDTGGFNCSLIGISCGDNIQISAEVDYEKRVTESNENNNSITKYIGIAESKKTYRFVDENEGIEYEYPVNLNTKFINTQKWPPVATVKTGSFVCVPAPRRPEGTLRPRPLRRPGTPEADPPRRHPGRRGGRPGVGRVRRRCGRLRLRGAPSLPAAPLAFPGGVGPPAGDRPRARRPRRRTSSSASCPTAQ
ncbi:MAG: hypothetical protein ACOX5G_07805 [Kiritimatiellia bacterium]